MSNVNFRIMPYNYLDSDVIANSYYTSQQTAFPASNLYNKQRRSKVWRSNGYFNVTSSNNGIVFKESGGGGTLTASIAVAEYTSISSLLTAIKAALEDVGAQTYTVTQSYYRFQIASGGSYLDLLCTNAGFTAYDLLGFDNTSDRTGALTYIADEARIHQYEALTWDMGVSTNPDMFALIGKRNASIGLSPKAVIKLQGNETNVWTSPSYEQTLTYDDEALLQYATTSGLHTEALRYWRLYIQDRTNPLGYIELAKLYLGDYFNPARGRVQFPLKHAFIDRSETHMSEGGQTYSDAREQSAEYQATWVGLQKADIEEFKTIFETYGTARPFFISADTASVFSSANNRRILFCKFTDAPDYALVSPDNFEMSMNFREEL